MAVYDDDRDVTFEIIEEIGIISTQDTGWTKEINLVRWNGGMAKYDIRDWDPYHQKMSRGITLKEDEMRRILDLMRRRRMNARNSRSTGSVTGVLMGNACTPTASASGVMRRENPASFRDSVSIGGPFLFSASFSYYIRRWRQMQALRLHILHIFPHEIYRNDDRQQVY